MKDITCFVCCQVVKWHFAARALFFYLIPVLFLETQITGVKNFRRKKVVLYIRPPKYKHPPVYNPSQKFLWIGIRSGLYSEFYGIISLRKKYAHTEFFLVRTQSKYMKIRTRKNSVFGHFSRSVYYFTGTPGTHEKMKGRF